MREDPLLLIEDLLAPGLSRRSVQKMAAKAGE